MKKGLTIVKHNHLIEASYRLNLDEQRLVLACIAKVDPRVGKDFPDEITVTAQEFAHHFGLKLTDSYQFLKSASKKLFNRSIRLKDGSSEGELRWVYRVEYHQGEAKVSLKFSPDIKPYLGQLNGMFKSYKLKHVSRLTSPHAIRLYELLNQWRGTGHRYINIDDFKDMLLLREKYSRYADLRKWVIEPALEEINQKTDFKVGFSVEKKGRKVNTLKFKFSI